jgi:hypothetical protein
MGISAQLLAFASELNQGRGEYITGLQTRRPSRWRATPRKISPNKDERMFP